MAKPHSLVNTTGFYSYQLGVYGKYFEDASLAIEYRHAKVYTAYHLHPIGGVLLTTADDWFAFLGLMRDFYTDTSWVNTLSFSVMGYYHSSSQGRDLDFPLEFRSKIERAYCFANQMRLGVGLSHISNANLSRISSDGHNPGVEILSLSLTVPLMKKTSFVS